MHLRPRARRPCERASWPACACACACMRMCVCAYVCMEGAMCMEDVVCAYVHEGCCVRVCIYVGCCAGYGSAKPCVWVSGARMHRRVHASLSRLIYDVVIYTCMIYDVVINTYQVGVACT